MLGSITFACLKDPKMFCFPMSLPIFCICTASFFLLACDHTYPGSPQLPPWLTEETASSLQSNNSRRLNCSCSLASNNTEPNGQWSIFYLFSGACFQEKSIHYVIKEYITNITLSLPWHATVLTLLFPVSLAWTKHPCRFSAHRNFNLAFFVCSSSTHSSLYASLI